MKPRGHIELASGTWWLRLVAQVADPETGEISRRRRRVCIGPSAELRSRVAARTAADEWLARVALDVLVPGPQVQAVAYLEHFLKTHAALYRETSRRKYAGIVRHYLIPAFGRLRLDQVDVPAIQKLIADLAPRLARATVASIRGVALQILRQAIRDGYGARRIDSRDLKLPKGSAAEREQRAIGDDELVRILDASTWPWRALWAVMGLGGLRISEALGLSWAHVDLERRVLRIRQSAVDGQLQPPKTRTSRADVPIIAPLYEILTEYRKAWRPNDACLLFTTRRGTPYRADDVRRRVLRPLLARMGLRPAGCHALRHGLPARLSAAGMSPDAVQRFMRHSNLAMTQRYLHLGQAEFRAAIADAEQRIALRKITQPCPSLPNASPDAAGNTA